MSSPGIAYVPRSDATLETELDALASVYKIVLDCGERHRAEEMKNAVAKCDKHRDGDDGTEIKGDSAYGRSIL